MAYIYPVCNGCGRRMNDCGCDNRAHLVGLIVMVIVLVALAMLALARPAGAADIRCTIKPTNVVHQRLGFATTLTDVWVEAWTADVDGAIFEWDGEGSTGHSEMPAGDHIKRVKLGRLSPGVYEFVIQTRTCRNEAQLEVHGDE